MNYESTELREALKSRKYDLTAEEIASIMKEQNTDISEKLLAAFKAVVTAMHTEAGTLWFMDDDNMIRAKASCGGGDLSNAALAPGEGIAGRVISDGGPLLISDCSNTKIWKFSVDKKTGFQTKTMICVPLQQADRTPGCIQLINKTDGTLFDNKDFGFALEMADEISDYISNIEERFTVYPDNSLLRREYLGDLILKSGSGTDMSDQVVYSPEFASLTRIQRYLLRRSIRRIGTILQPLKAQ